MEGGATTFLAGSPVLHGLPCAATAQNRIWHVRHQEDNAIVGVDNDITIHIQHADANFHQDEFLLCYS